MKTKIGQIEFATKKQAEEYVRSILHRYGPMQSLDPGDFKFAMAILRQHAHSDTIIGQGIKDIRVQHLPDGHRRFVLIRADGEWRDFTWRHAIYPRNAKQDVCKVCRFLIRNQISLFKDSCFGPLDVIVCPLTGELTAWEDAIVDHAAPNTFDALVQKWIKTEGVSWESVEIVPSPRYQEESQFLDQWMAKRWVDYHRQHSKLRILSAVAHRALPREKSEAI